MADSRVFPEPGKPALVQPEGAHYFCRGDWTLAGIEDLDSRLAGVNWPNKDLQLDGSGIGAIDTTGALRLLNLVAELERAGHPVTLIGLRPEQRALLDLVRERRADAGVSAPPLTRSNPLERLGRAFVSHAQAALQFLGFVGEAAVSLVHALWRPDRLRWRALFGNIEDAGVRALPIIALLAFMLGIVIAYQGGQQLKIYGANIFIVELISLTMLRELAPLITAIIVAGRTGSAYTAQIGTMQITEEVDALRTIGIAPMDLLVLPKLLALVIALPLLTVFADALSLFGGMVMAQALLDVSFTDFLERVPRVVTLTSFLLGVGKAPVFAAIIALVGCYQGFHVRGGADSVGRQTTVSVVQSIFLVIAADALFSVVLGGIGL